MNGHYVTTGSVLVGLLALAARLVPWYRKHGRKKNSGGDGSSGKGKLAPLGPFIWTLVLGTLSALATGGLLGQAARGVAQSGNTVGDQMLSMLAGADSPGATRDGIRMLTPGGSVLLVVLLLGCLLWFWMHGWRIRLEMILGYLAGVTLGPTAGLAGIAGVVLSPIFNIGGNWIVMGHG